VQHLREHTEPDFDTCLPGSVGKHSAVIDKGFITSGLQIDRRESCEIRVERICMWIARVTIANEILRQPLHCWFREKGIFLTVGHVAGPGSREIEPTRHDHRGGRLRETGFPSSLQHANSQNRPSRLSGKHDVFGLDALVQ